SHPAAGRSAHLPLVWTSDHAPGPRPHLLDDHRGGQRTGRISVRRPVLDRRPVEPPVSVGGSTRLASRVFGGRGVSGNGLGRFRHAAPHGDLLPHFHPVGGCRLPPPGGLQHGPAV